MASNLRRSKRTFGQRFLRAEEGIDSSNRRPSPRRIGSRIVTSRNLAPGAVTTVTLASDVSTSIAFAQATADGKNTIYYQTTVPTGGTYAVDDIWFDTDDDHKMYRYNGSAWAAFQLGDNAIAELSADKLTAGTIDANVITVSNLDAGNITVGTLSGITISGNTITGGTITIGSSNNVFKVDTNGNMWLGNATYASAPFRVSNAGALVASSATITGGTITVGSSNSVFKVDSSGNMWLGNSSYSSAPFRVSNAGALVASSATITGTINATAGTFSGDITSTATISGGTISLNSDRIRLTPSITFNDGVSSGTVSALRIHNNTSSAAVQSIANGIYFQDPNTSSVFSKIAGNTWLGAARLDITGPRNSFDVPRIGLSQDYCVMTYPRASTGLYESQVFLGATAATIGFTNGPTVTCETALIKFNSQTYFNEDGTNVIRTYTNTSNGLGVIRTGSNDATHTPITINTTHGGLSGAYYMISFYHNGGNIGSISHNGVLTTSYNTSSDYRLKKDIRTITDGLDKIKQITPRYYKFISNEDAGEHAGFIAHELQDIVPHITVGEKDAVDENGEPRYQQIEKAGVVPYIVSAIKDLAQQIEDLQARIESFSA